MMHQLIGKVITGLELTEDRIAVRFLLGDEKPVVAVCDADCCSSTWVEHISLPAGGFPAVVLEAADLEMPDLGDQPGRDFMQYYGFQVKTDKGYLIIDYRNESNGYYGGSLCWQSEHHYGGVYGQNTPMLDWRAVTEDE
jgi:hypothetical protein